MEKILFLGNNSIFKDYFKELNIENYHIDSKSQVPEKLSDIYFKPYSAVILDFYTLKDDSYVLCKTIKELCFNIHILFLFPIDTTEQSILKCYQVGADDYLYPLLSSIKILQKKLDFLLYKKSNSINITTYSDSHITLDFNSFSASIDDNQITFTPFEFKLLKLFSQNPYTIITRKYILYFLWDKGENYVTESSLNSIICRIRKKIDTKKHRYFKTIYGIGYIWTPYKKSN